MLTSRLKTFFDYPWEYPALFLLIFSLPFSVRNVLWTFSPEGIFNEYTDISLYLSDLLLALFGLVIILQYKIVNKSSISNMFHVEHMYVLPFLLWSFATILWAQNLPLALYSSIKILEGCALFVLLTLVYRIGRKRMFHAEQIGDYVPRGTKEKIMVLFHVEQWLMEKIKKCSTWNMEQWLFWAIILSGSFQAIIALAQFSMQASIGLIRLGESALLNSLPGVAEVVLVDQTLLRAYGLFPHPNVLGGFLSITLLISVFYPLVMHKKMFHVEHFYFPILLKLSIGIQFLALLSTFSKSAFLGFVIAFSFMLYQFHKMFHVKQTSQRLPSETKKWKRMFHVEHFLIFISILLLTIAVFRWINTEFLVIQPAQERLLLYQSLLNFSIDRVIFGLGSGQYVLLMQDFFSQALQVWQFQPIHNVFLLILAETGVIGLGLFAYFLYAVFFQRGMFHVEQLEYVPRGTILRKIFSYALLLGILIPAMTDHYWWDIQQGQLLFWLVLGIAYAFKLDK